MFTLYYILCTIIPLLLKKKCISLNLEILYCQKKPHSAVDANFQFLSFFFLEGLHCAACGILALQIGIKPTFPALEAWNCNYKTIREVPQTFDF